MLKFLQSTVQSKGVEVLKYFDVEIDWFIMCFITTSFNFLIVAACVIVSLIENLCLRAVSGIVMITLLAILNTSMVKKMASLKAEVPAKKTGTGTIDKLVCNDTDTDTFVIPNYFIEHDDAAKITSLKVNLPGCNKEWIRVKIWNKRQLHLLAFSQVHRYKLQYQFPIGARLLKNPAFTVDEEVLTCKFQSLNPVCKACGCYISRYPTMQTKDSPSDFEAVSVLEADQLSSHVSSLERVKPRFWITYDDKMALFETHLLGCSRSSHINFKISNHKVMIWTALEDQRHYLLELFLESSAKRGWKTHFDPKMEMFTCAIPLLGYYECDRCKAERHQDEGVNESYGFKGAELALICTSVFISKTNVDVNGQNAERVVGVEMEEARDLTEGLL